MKRTSLGIVFAVLCGPGPAPVAAQQPKPAAAAQPDPIEGIVQAMRDAEQRAKSFRIELTTRGRMQGGLEFTTSGSLDVLRGAQPRTRSAVEFQFVGEVGGRMATVHTEQGITIYQDDPAFGEVFVHIEAALVADLEWAGGVLARADLPGMRDRRAGAPLGSAMLDDLRRNFDLAVTAKKDRNGDAGQWLAGDRKPGLGDQDPDLPLATRVEVFVRDKDKAMLQVVHHQGERVLQQIEVKRLEVDVEIPAAVFQLDGNGQRLREVRHYPPLWGEIQDVIKQAETKAGPDAVRPSKRPK